MTICTLIVGCCLLGAPPAADSSSAINASTEANANTTVVAKLRFSELETGDQLTITTSKQTLFLEVIDSETGEVRMSTSADRTPRRAFINGATAGPQPEIFVLMGVVKTGLKLEVVATEDGGADSKTGRSITAPVEKIERGPRDTAA